MNLVITGTSSGIGRSLAERLLDRGHQVWGLARSDQSDLEKRHRPSFHAARCDVADWKQMAQTAAEVAKAWAHLDGLITCAGLQGEIGRTVTANPEKWDATVRANLEGTFHAIRAFHGLLSRAPRRGKIVCFSGGGATKARPRFSAYGVAKTGVVRLVETIAEEEKASPLDINALAPGAIATRLTSEVLALGPEVVGQEEFKAAQKHRVEDTAPLEKALTCVEWLLSPQSDGISGRLISAPWDPWQTLASHRETLAKSDIYTLRRILPEERGSSFGGTKP